MVSWPVKLLIYFILVLFLLMCKPDILNDKILYCENK